MIEFPSLFVLEVCDSALRPPDHRTAWCREALRRRRGVEGDDTLVGRRCQCPARSQRLRQVDAPASCDRPVPGEVLLWGQVLAPRTIGPLRRRLGYVIQEGGLFPHLTAGANVTLAAR